ncbi:MAG: UDP-2,3-diacylglucosamine diphosphatase, partial [Chitinophagaceae bacterium]
IHPPEIKEIVTDNGSITYLNSGDWIENLSSLEYTDGQWRIYRFTEDHEFTDMKKQKDEDPELSNNQIFDNLLQEFNLMRT